MMNFMHMKDGNEMSEWWKLMRIEIQLNKHNLPLKSPSVGIEIEILIAILV
jgi:hypothetical protein